MEKFNILIFIASIFIANSFGADPAGCGSCPPLVNHQIISLCKPVLTACNANNVINVQCSNTACLTHWQSPKGISTRIGPSADIVCNQATGKYYIGTPDNHVTSVSCR